MSIERKTLRRDRQFLKEDLRKHHYPLLGLEPDVEAGRFGRYWPELELDSQSIIPPWIRQEASVVRRDKRGHVVERPYLNRIREWRDGIAKIFEVRNFSEVIEICSQEEVSAETRNRIENNLVLLSLQVNFWPLG